MIHVPDARLRSSDVVERQLIRAIVTGEYLPDSPLPSERDMATQLGVGRPTVREVLQRLERDGWIRARKGQPSIVNDFWHNGNLNTLVNIVQNMGHTPSAFIIYLLDFRTVLTPAYIRNAVERHPAKVVALLAQIDSLADSPETYAVFDWNLQKSLAQLADNPIYLLVLNSFDQIYVTLSLEYFHLHPHRQSSLQFYRRLLEAAMACDSHMAEIVTRDAMAQSEKLWLKRDCE